jgi:transcriptional regulator with XRE-family HTH domain
MDLATYLRSSGQTLTAFARKAGVNHSVIVRILSGERKPNWTTMRRIAAASEGQVKDLEDFVFEPTYSIDLHDYMVITGNLWDKLYGSGTGNESE